MDSVRDDLNLLKMLTNHRFMVRPMKGRSYATIEKIKTASKEELNKISKIFFLKCFEDCKKLWNKYIISGGDYFEGDKIDIHE